ENASNGNSGDVLSVLRAGQAGVDEAVRTREGDVTADSATDEGGDDDEVDLVREHGLLQGLADRWGGHNGHVDHQQDHQGAKDHDDAVQGCTGPLGEEDQRGDQRGERATDDRIGAKHSVGTKAGTADVSDIEDQAADEDERAHDPTEARQYGVAKLIGAHPGDAEDAPDIQLDGDVHEDRHQNREGEGRAQLDGEHTGLCDEAGTNGAGGHQEHSPHRGGAGGPSFGLG